MPRNSALFALLSAVSPLCAATPPLSVSTNVWAAGARYSGETPRTESDYAGIGVVVARPYAWSVDAGTDGLVARYADYEPVREWSGTLGVGAGLGAWWVRGAAHAERDLDQGRTVATAGLVGITRYGQAWNLGLDLAASRLSVADPANRSGQATLRGGYTILRRTRWDLGVSGWVTGIRLENPLDDGRRSFVSGGADLGLGIKGWRLFGGGWIGRQAQTVRQDGYVLLSTTEQSVGGWNAGVGTTLGRVGMQLRFEGERYTSGANDDPSRALRAGVLVSVRF